MGWGGGGAIVKLPPVSGLQPGRNWKVLAMGIPLVVNGNMENRKAWAWVVVYR